MSFPIKLKKKGAIIQMHEPSFSHKQSYMHLNLKDQNRSKVLVIKLKRNGFPYRMSSYSVHVHEELIL